MPKGAVRERDLESVREGWLGKCPLEKMLLTTVDPGINDWISACWQTGCFHPDSRDSPKTWTFSTGEYFEKAGFTQRRKWQEKKLHQAANNLEQWQSELPSSRTASVQGLQQVVWVTTKRLREVCSFYWQRPMRARRKKVMLCRSESSLQSSALVSLP